MAETTVPTPGPTPAPAPSPAPTPKATHLLLPKWLAALVPLVLVVNLAIAGWLLYERGHKPAPPTPAPAAGPVARVTGVFIPTPSTGVNAGPDAPLGILMLDASASKSERPIRWRVKGPALNLTVLTPDGGLASSHAQAVVTKPGTYRVHAIAREADDADIDAFEKEISGPGPGPPDPPEPPPDPPPAPDETAPIKAPGLRVLFIYESADLGKYPREQIAAFYDQSFRDYLASACVKVGTTPEYRVWDKDVDTANESAIWQAAMKRPHPELPWMVVSNGKAGYEGKIPANLAETRALVQKYEVKP